VEGNPINYTDPTGMYSVISFTCQSMPSRALYELCILQSYHLEPFDLSKIGETVQGSKGCYTGPTNYRGPGYLEGIGGYVSSGVTRPVGIETVYDFAMMQRASFTYGGFGGSNTLVGAGVSMYFGTVLGFKSPGSIISEYRDVSVSLSVGASVIVGGGRGYFVSVTDPIVRGQSWYVGGGLSHSWWDPPVDVSLLLTRYDPVSPRPEPYILDDGSVNRARLYSDILSGVDSPWNLATMPTAPGDPYNEAESIYLLPRIYGLFLAMKYAYAYEELHNE
jgi:hypothetical protein